MLTHLHICEKNPMRPFRNSEKPFSYSFIPYIPLVPGFIATTPKMPHPPICPS